MRPSCVVVSARCYLTVSLVLALVGLAPLAYADPLDPTWISGYWDDDDFDTVVAFIGSTFATLAQPDVDPQPCLVWIDDAPPASPTWYRPSWGNARRPRAPPSTSTLLIID